MKKILFIIFLLIIFSYLSSALTARIGNSLILVPAEIEGEEIIIEKTISIDNTNPASVDVSLRASDEIKNVVEIVDNNFALQSRETKDARFNIRLNKAGEYVGTIWVKISASGEVPIELPVRVVISAKSTGSEEAKQKQEENKTKISFNIKEAFSNIGTQKSVVLLSLLTTILSCILLFLLYQIKKKEDKKKRERGTLKKIDKDRLKK